MIISFASIALVASQLVSLASADVLVSNFAGRSRVSGYKDARGSSAKFGYLSGLAFGPDGYLYVSDNSNQRIRRISPRKIVSTYAGSGAKGLVDGKAKQASLYYPNGLVFDRSGNLYVADSTNNCIRRIATDGTVTKFAGTGVRGHQDGSLDQASFYFPTGLAIDASGNIYVADTRNNLIRKISNGMVTTIAGSHKPVYTRGQVNFNNPTGLVLDAQNNIYVADSRNNVIRKIAPDGTITTHAGTGAEGYVDGHHNRAKFNEPKSITIDPRGNLYIAEFGNNIIRKINPYGLVSTLAGTGAEGHTDGFGLDAKFFHPEGIVYHDNQLFVTDAFNNVVRKIDLFDSEEEPPVPIRSVSPKPIRYNEDKCAICLEVKKDDKEYYYCSEECGNSFHIDCIHDCVGNGVGKSCPTCRAHWRYDRVPTRIAAAIPTPK